MQGKTAVAERAWCRSPDEPPAAFATVGSVPVCKNTGVISVTRLWKVLRGGMPYPPAAQRLYGDLCLALPDGSAPPLPSRWAWALGTRLTLVTLALSAPSVHALPIKQVSLSAFFAPGVVPGRPLRRSYTSLRTTFSYMMGGALPWQRVASRAASSPGTRHLLSLRWTKAPSGTTGL